MRGLCGPILEVMHITSPDKSFIGTIMCPYPIAREAQNCSLAVCSVYILRVCLLVDS